jgi:hypothetical protein
VLGITGADARDASLLRVHQGMGNGKSGRTKMTLGKKGSKKESRRNLRSWVYSGLQDLATIVRYHRGSAEIPPCKGAHNVDCP